jgi:hypothetical protein
LRLILSRKGFDSAAGGCPSPIFTDGSMFSLPIPDKQSPIRYSDISWNGWNVGDLVTRMTGGKQRADYRVHLDPDLRPDALARAEGWRPSLGQLGASQAHLRNEGVTAGDLFLFFGLFRAVGRDLKPTGPRVHLIWGWLQVGEILSVDDDVRRTAGKWRWLERHPHLAFERDGSNTLYLGADRLSLQGFSRSIPGAGVFESFSAARKLTAVDGARVTEWSLPLGFLPRGRRPLSYHLDEARWSASGSRARLRAAARGQEFVLHLDEYPEVAGWLGDLLAPTAD